MSMITETQVANKALQRVGADAIDDGVLWTENSRNAKEIRKTYDISRRTELRRNVWRFSIRTQILRPVDTDTKRVTFAAWSVVTAYVTNDVVLADGQLWMAQQDTMGTDPADHDFTVWSNYFGNTIAHPWDADTTWMAGELVYVGSDTYISLQNDNTDNLVSDTAFWQPFTTMPTLSAAKFIYPIGAGPASNTQTRNVYMLPYGFVREAPQSPRQGSQLSLGAPSGLSYTDWYYESSYFTTTTVGPIPYRFAADIEDPAAWDPMFVDGFSCRLALDVCEVLTQSTAKLGAIGSAYLKFMSEARQVNGIEIGPVEPPEDLYITVRL